MRGLSGGLGAGGEVDRQLAFVHEGVEARVDEVFHERVHLMQGVGGELGILARQHAAHEVAALGGGDDLPPLHGAGHRDAVGGTVEHARTPAGGAMLGDCDDVPLVDQALQMLADGVGVQLRGGDDLGDRALRLLLHQVEDLDTRVAGDGAVPRGATCGHTTHYSRLRPCAPLRFPACFFRSAGRRAKCRLNRFRRPPHRPNRSIPPAFTTSAQRKRGQRQRGAAATQHRVSCGCSPSRAPARRASRTIPPGAG